MYAGGMHIKSEKNSRRRLVSRRLMPKDNVPTMPVTSLSNQLVSKNFIRDIGMMTYGSGHSRLVHQIVKILLKAESVRSSGGTGSTPRNSTPDERRKFIAVFSGPCS
jgi:hypothetical protein